MYCQIDWSRLDRITPHTQTTAEIAAPAEPIVMGVLLPAGIYHTPTYTGRVAVARYNEPVAIHWIERTKYQRKAEPVKVTVR